MNNELNEMFANFNTNPETPSSSEGTNAVIEENKSTSATVIPNEESLDAVDQNTVPNQSHITNGEQNNTNPFTNSMAYQIFAANQYSIFYPVLNKPFFIQNNVYIVALDSTVNVAVCLVNQNNNQLYPCADIKRETNEFVIYQNGIKLGTLDYTSNPQMLYFVQAGSSAYNQNNLQPSSKADMQQYSYNFNNVPPEQAKDIIDSIIKNKPECPVNISFATQSSPQEIINADEQEVIDITVDAEQ